MEIAAVDCVVVEILDREGRAGRTGVGERGEEEGNLGEEGDDIGGRVGSEWVEERTGTTGEAGGRRGEMGGGKVGGGRGEMGRGGRRGGEEGGGRDGEWTIE